MVFNSTKVVVKNKKIFNGFKEYEMTLYSFMDHIHKNSGLTLSATCEALFLLFSL